MSDRLFAQISPNFGGGDGPRVAVPPSGRVQVDAGQERGKFGGGHLDATGGGVRKAEGAAFEPLDLGITMPSFLCRYTNSVCAGYR